MAPTFQSDVGTIHRVLLRQPADAFQSERVIDQQWQSLGYSARPDLRSAVEEYDGLVATLQGLRVEIVPAGSHDALSLDSIYVRDAAVMCDRGAILCNMGKPARRSEPEAVAGALRKNGVPIHGAITGNGRLEGGDVVWLNRRALAVGRGYRTNDEGIRQLRSLLRDCVDEFFVVPLPHWRGPTDVFHLMSIISPIDEDLALVHSPLLPVPFREALLAWGLTLVDVDESEFDTLGCNVLAVAPRKGLMVAGNPTTRSRLEDHGVEVLEFPGREICAKGAGGPTCLTRPLERAAK